MAIAEAALPRFEIGRVIKRTLNVIPNNIGAFALFSLVPALSSAAMEWGMSQFGSPAALIALPGSGMIALIIAAGAAYFVSWFVLQAAVVHGAVASFNGRRASIGDCLATGLKHFVPVVLIGLIATVAVIAAALFLIVPGIILALMWVVAIPVCVVEHTGVGRSFDRSSELTKGYRWPLFGLFLLYFGAVLICLVGFGALIGIALVATSNGDLLSNTTSSLAIDLGSEVIGTMVSAIVLSALVASVYFELRQIKEGVGPEALASVFD